jgi:hypothetical protein
MHIFELSDRDLKENKLGSGDTKPPANADTPACPDSSLSEPEKGPIQTSPKRFDEFRTHLGKYVKNGNTDNLNSSLYYYASKATGDDYRDNPRRFGTASKTGGRLLLAVMDLLEDPITAEFSAAMGKPLQNAIAMLSDLLAPFGEEEDKVRFSIAQALTESAKSQSGDFDPDFLKKLNLRQLLINYLSEILYNDISLMGPEAYEKPNPPDILAQRENNLKETIRKTVTNVLPEFSDTKKTITEGELINIQQATFKAVFAEWNRLKS